MFTKVMMSTAPAVPGGDDGGDSDLPEGRWSSSSKPDARPASPACRSSARSPRSASKLPSADNKDFARNMANRLWFVLMGRGLVHPLDLHHSGNPGSHPEVLDLLPKEFVAHKFDMKWLLREMALTQDLPAVEPGAARERNRRNRSSSRSRWRSG